jgi:hypothetical protein
MNSEDFELGIVIGFALLLGYIFTQPKRAYASDAGQDFLGSSASPYTPKAPAKSGSTKAKSSGGGTGGAHPNWECITHRDRLQVLNNNATVTGTVIPAGDGGSHYAPDGDLVFAFKPDPQYSNMVNDVNKINKKYGGGLWVEGVCQKANKAKEPRHQGDCKCNATKFPKPKNGQRLRITGAHVKDVGEEGHLELHPIYSMEVIS